MTIAELKAAGTVLYGHRWQSALAADMGVAARTVRAWTAGRQPVTAARAAQIRALLEARMWELGELLA